MKPCSAPAYRLNIFAQIRKEYLLYLDNFWGSDNGKSAWHSFYFPSNSIFAGIIFIQKFMYSTATNQGKQSYDTVTPTAEAISYSSQAHYATVKLFAKHLKTGYHGGKSPWPEVRPQLLKYWSSSWLTAGKNFMNTIYKTGVMKWVCFPFGKQIILWSFACSTIVAIWLWLELYHFLRKIDTIRVILVCDHGRWVMDSGFLN